MRCGEMIRKDRSHKGEECNFGRADGFSCSLFRFYENTFHIKVHAGILMPE